mgnify:CR=1 FL=1
MRRWRHLLVALMIVPALMGYIIIAVFLADVVTGISFIIDFLYYLIAGLIWIPGAAIVIRWLADNEAQ